MMRWICFIALLSISNLLPSQNRSLFTFSSVQFPFKIKIKSLEDITNQTITGIIYIDSSYTNDDNDQLKCTVWKDGQIKITSVKNNVLKIDVPLKVWIEKGIGAFGVYKYKSTDFRLIMSFHLVYNITNDWKLISKTLKNGYVWTHKPSLNFVSVQIPITPIVEKILDKKQSVYAAQIDQQLAKNINLKSKILEVWNTMKQPQKISDEYNTWLAMIPGKVEAQQFTQDDTYIKSAFKVEVQMLSCIGSDSSLRTPIAKDIPPLVYRNFQTDSFQLYTFVAIPYSEATQIARQKFINTDFSFKEGKYQVRVTGISIYSENAKLVIETDLLGSFNGKVYIQGDLYYDESKGAVRMRNLEFDMKTKNIIHKLATWLFNKKIEKNLEENFEMPIADLLTQSIASTNKALNRTQNGFQLLGKVWYMAPVKLDCDLNSIILTLQAKGQLAIVM